MAHEHDAVHTPLESGGGADGTPQAGVGALNYTDLPGLEDVCLEDSFVREVVQDGGTLTFVLIAALRKGHAYHDAPRSNERHCFRPATLAFREAQVKWRSRSKVRFVDAQGAVDVGNIDVLIAPAEGGYHIAGDFGVVDLVRSRAPVFTVVGESSPIRTYRRASLQRWVSTGSALAGEHEHRHPHETDPAGGHEQAHADHHGHARHGAK